MMTDLGDHVADPGDHDHPIRAITIRRFLHFSPDDPNHITEIERVLSQFTFEYQHRPYACTHDQLVALGRKFDPTRTTDAGALQKGVEQFKLTLQQLKDGFRNDSWLRNNCLVAIAAGTGDGTSGLQNDGAFTAFRQEIELFAHVIFSSQESTREFWLGHKEGNDRATIERTYGALKPCLHGCDAHKVSDVLHPTDDRYCWIRAGLSFDGLKQTLLEPEDRVLIGTQPPSGPAPSDCIASLTVTEAPWLTVGKIELNPGLVAIIGPKGSGKTALADLIAHAANAPIHEGASFLIKAHEHLGDGEANLQWANGEESQPCRLADEPQTGMHPSVRYLSQQFVERLCSADGVAGELLGEMEAVVFQAIPEEERLGSTSFAELRELELGELREAREGILLRIEELTTKIASEDDKKAKLPGMLKQQAEHSERLKKTENDLRTLLPKNKTKEATELGPLQTICSTKEKQLQVLRLRQTKIPQFEESYKRLTEDWGRGVQTLRERFPDIGIDAADWFSFSPAISKAVGPIIEKTKTATEAAIEHLLNGDPKKPASPTDQSTWPLAKLRARIETLTKAIGVEKERTKKFSLLQKQVEGLKLEGVRIQKEIDDTKKSDERRKAAIEERRKAYAEVFDLYSREEAILEKLYAPLKVRLNDGAVGASRLSFHVERRIDLDAWIERGEELLDLRKAGVFQGRGKLAEIARAKLLPVWRSGNSAAVAAAMDGFVTEHMRALLESRAAHVGFDDVGRWFFSTDHVQLAYGIEYDGQSIGTLSPGMKGIVLLMLYLAVDEWDLRPLIVDQPEENLDPQSVYDELVGYFRQSKRRRQVILVTHNPNLVVNADADQVIVASAKRNGLGLPEIGYTSGGLEDRQTREDVCRILEGGERAFLEREQRYSFAEPS
jgi:ABC-type lipoprotein export system ATPase subunit